MSFSSTKKSALDSKTKVLMLIMVATLLKKLKESGISVFVVTHDAELIENCCTEVVSMEDALLGGGSL